MKNHLKTEMILGALLLLIGVVAVGCTSPTPTAAPTAAPVATAEPTAAPAPGLTGNPVRGGLLYDMWWEVLAAEKGHDEAMEGVGEPSTDHPLWKTQSTNTRAGSDTWRCKECHGWDYKGVDGAYGSGSHKTGFVGIFESRGKTASEILAALKGSTNPDHDFSTVMDEQDLIDLALFVAQGQVDLADYVNADKSAKGGDAAAGTVKYEGVCIYCHGPQGNAINFASIEEPEFVGHVAADNPWEFVHKVRFGQPGWPMPSAITNEWTDQDIANVLAYSQTLSTEPAVSGGGVLYDAWWEVVGAEAPTTDQLLWKTQTTNTRTGPDTWRCKECHGWDYQGVDGAYGAGSHQTGFPGIRDAASMSSEDLTAWLTGAKNPDHDFSQVLDEAYINALVTFVQKETLDSAAYINADKTANGDAARGKVKFEKTCAACHGTDGKKLNFGDAAEPEYVGTVAADNPWEFFHKASFGHPGAPMPSGIALGYTLEDLASLAAYVQTLPAK
ncbi:MAG TPA: c-type cytochrome [Anaerolineales bacterium]|nr:c-type cytochrome [Anaerolineales bacterium]